MQAGQIDPASAASDFAVRHGFDQLVPRRVLFLHGRRAALIDQPRRLQRAAFITDILQVLADVL